MRVLIAHLSDIHLKSQSDPVLSRIASVAAAINSRQEDAALVLIALTGDIAATGKPAEYVIASELIASLQGAISGNSVVAVVPGNHDCDFTLDTVARDILIKALLHDPSTCIDASVIDTLTTVQRPFFEFRDALDASLLDDHGKAFYQYKIPCGDCVISLRCVNTAWTSRLKETAGELYFPESLIPEPQEHEFSITLFHHPYNWLSPSSKGFIRKVERTSDLILTGHEHEYDRSAKQKPDTGKVTNYVEGAALQDHESSAASGFNLALVDIKKQLQKFYHFSWNGELYATKSTESWQPLPLGSRHVSASLRFSVEFAAWLEDPGIPNAAREGTQRKLEDFFIYPDLLESLRDLALKNRRESIRSDRVFETIARFGLTVLSGDPKSGRTAFARKLMVDFYSIGLVPVYCDTLDGIRPEAEMPQSIVVKAKSQYGASAEEVFRQAEPRNRVLIVDNVDRSKGRLEARRLVLEHLGNIFGHIVLLGDDSAGKITEMTPIAGAGSDTQCAYRIRPFSHQLMEKLSQSWFASDDANDAEYSLRLEDAAKTLTTILGHNYIPAYPIYIISVLKALEDGVLVNASASTHGYFYELLIKSALAVNSDNKDINIRMEFLTHLAYEMFCAGKDALLESELAASYERYQALFEVGGLDYGQLIEALVVRGMMVRDADSVRFRYPYLYFYFVANHLKKLASPDARAQVVSLAKDLNNARSSDIVMFLVHLSYDPFVLNEIVNAADLFFRDDAPATLDDLAGEEPDEDIELEYIEVPQAEARVKAAATKDHQLAVAEKSAPRKVDFSPGDTTRTFSGALQTVRILGQILRNYPGALQGETKASLAGTSCRLGLRALAAALRIIEAGKDDTISYTVSEVRRSYSNIPEERLKTKAERYVRLLKVITTFGVTRTVSEAISARELEPTYRRIFKDELTPAMQLIRASVSLEMGQGFPAATIEAIWETLKGKYWPGLLLKVLVLEHFQRVYVDQRVRQRICAILNIKYTPMLTGVKNKQLQR